MALLSAACKVLRGLFITGWMCTAAPEATLAATRYIDGGCSLNGNGTTTNCATTNGGAGAFNSWTNAISATWNSGDVFEARGAHPSHTGCAASFFTNGVYRGDRIQIRNKSNFTLQGYHYGLFDAERPVIESTSAVTWVPCFQHESDTQCTSIPGPSNEFFYYNNTTANVGTIAALSTSGRVTYRVSSKSDMTNAHAGYITAGCSGQPYIGCKATSVPSDCPVGESCIPGIVPEFDSFNGGTYLLVRWGTSTSPGTVYFTNNGYGFDIATGTNFTVRGFTFRTYRAGVTHSTDGGGVDPTSVTISDNQFIFGVHQGSGYQLAFYGVTPLTITNNYFAYSRDEAIHTDARDDTSPMVMTITGNFIKDVGDYNILGPETAYCSTSGSCPGTPTSTPCHSSADCPGTACCASTSEGMTLSSGTSSSHTGPGDYSGSLIANNYILRTGKNGIIFENNHHGTSGNHETVRDNIINGTVRAGFKIACDNSTASSSVAFIDFYNNIIFGANSGGSDAGVRLVQGNAACTVDSLNFYNNTIYGSGVGIQQENTQFSNNIFRNNLISSGSSKGINWTNATASNKFEYNFVQTTADPNAVTWLNVSHPCNDIGSAGTGNVNGCSNPVFVNPTLGDFHINSFVPVPTLGGLSRVIDANTNSAYTLAARTASINNTVAEQYGLPDYSNGFPVNGVNAFGFLGTDIGATELMVSDGGFESGSYGANWSQVDASCNCQNSEAATTKPYQGSYSGFVSLGLCGGTPVYCYGNSLTLRNLIPGVRYVLDGYYFLASSSGSYPAVFLTNTLPTNPTCLSSTAFGECGCFIHVEDPNTTVNDAWVNFTALFEADAPTHTIIFSAAGIPDYTIYFDNISVRPQ